MYFYKKKSIDKEIQTTTAKFDREPQNVILKKLLKIAIPVLIASIALIVGGIFLSQDGFSSTKNATASVNQQVIKNFKIVSVPYYSEKPYFVNLRIDFANSNSANLTINKFSGVDSRYSEIYFNHRMLRVNTLEKYIRVFHRNKQESDTFPLKTALEDEFDPRGDIERFIKKLRTSEFPANSFESGINAHIISWEILKKLSPALFEK